VNPRGKKGEHVENTKFQMDPSIIFLFYMISLFHPGIP
jgi:hypothetical protein